MISLVKILEEVEEALTPRQKLARKRAMAGKQRMIQRKRQRTALRKKGYKQLFKKAYKAAYKEVYEEFRLKLFPDVPKSELSVIQKKQIAKWTLRKKKRVMKRARFKYLPAFREKEIAKFKKNESGKAKSEKNYADWKADNELDETAKRDYKAEYKKFQSSTKAKKYRAELNKYNRDKGTYGNGDGKDASHKGGKIVGFESASKNRGRKEKSRLKKESITLDEIGIFPVNNYLKGMIPRNMMDTTTRQKKERLKSTINDLKSTLNHFWKSHDIPYRIK